MPIIKDDFAAPVYCASVCEFGVNVVYAYEFDCIRGVLIRVCEQPGHRHQSREEISLRNVRKIYPDRIFGWEYHFNIAP